MALKTVGPAYVVPSLEESEDRRVSYHLFDTAMGGMGEPSEGEGWDLLSHLQAQG